MSGGRTFDFYRVFDGAACQRDVYSLEAATLVRLAVVTGTNVAVLAYGMTGAGKTHTMLGSDAGRFVLAPVGVSGDEASPHTVTVDVGDTRLHVLNWHGAAVLVVIGDSTQKQDQAGRSRLRR